jgi:lysophospholipase L1-like esterase
VLQIVLPATRPDSPHKVTLTVKWRSGVSQSVTRDVLVKDYLILATGDSFASGQGNPDKPQVINNPISADAGPQWIDQRCARSAAAGPVQAALRLEQADPHTSVTLLFLACSGATIDKGLIGQYSGQLLPGKNPNPPLLPSQIEEAQKVICPQYPSRCRTVDMMTISIGGNDIGFADIVANCVKIDGATLLIASELVSHNSTLFPYCHEIKSFRDAIDTQIKNLSNKYTTLAGEIRGKLVFTGPVFITEYPDFTKNDHANYCGLEQSPRLMKALDWKSARWASENLMPALNKAVEAAAREIISGGVFVSGISDKYYFHGECAGGERWVNTIEDAIVRQGPYGIGFNPNCGGGIRDCIMSYGALHPNEKGHQAYSNAIAEKMFSFVGLKYTPQVFPSLPVPPAQQAAQAQAQAQASAALAKAMAIEEELARTITEGNLIRNNAGQIYLVQGGKRRYIPSMDLFNAWYFRPEEVRNLPDGSINRISQGPDLGPPNGVEIATEGSLVKGSTPEVYVVTGGQRRWIPSVEVFNARGYKWDRIRQLPDAIIAAIPRGTDLPPPPTAAERMRK